MLPLTCIISNAPNVMDSSVTLVDQTSLLNTDHSTKHKPTLDPSWWSTSVRSVRNDLPTTTAESAHMNKNKSPHDARHLHYSLDIHCVAISSYFYDHLVATSVAFL